jgi:hypothetical protein
MIGFQFRKIVTLCVLLCTATVTALSSEVQIAASQLSGFQPSNLDSAATVTIVATNGSSTLTSSAAFRTSWVNLSGFRVSIGATYYYIRVISTSSAIIVANASGSTAGSDILYAGATGSASMIVYPYVQARIFSNTAFYPLGDANEVPMRGPAAGPAYRVYAASVVNDGGVNKLWLPPMTLAATTDGAPNTARYTMQFFTPSGALVDTFRCGNSTSELRLPTTTPTSWRDVCTFNSTSSQPLPDGYLTSSQIFAILPSCTAGDLLYHAATGRPLTCLTLGSTLGITAGVLDVVASAVANVKPCRNAADAGIAVDGSGDQTAALQALINLKGDICLPPGTITIASTITLPTSDDTNSLRIQGAGRTKTIIQYTGTGSAFTAGGNRVDDIELRDFKLIATNGSNAGSGINLDVASTVNTRWLIEGVSIWNFGRWGITAQNIQSSRIIGNHIRGNKAGAIYLLDAGGDSFPESNRNTIAYNLLDNSPYDAAINVAMIKLNLVTGVDITGNTIQGHWLGGTGTKPAIYIGNSLSVKLDSNHIEGLTITGSGVEIVSSQAITMLNTAGSGNHSSDVTITGSRSIQCVNCRYQNSAPHFVIDSTSRDVTINGGIYQSHYNLTRSDSSADGLHVTGDITFNAEQAFTSKTSRQETRHAWSSDWSFRNYYVNGDFTDTYEGWSGTRSHTSRSNLGGPANGPYILVNTQADADGGAITEISQSVSIPDGIPEGVWTLAFDYYVENAGSPSELLRWVDVVMSGSGFSGQNFRIHSLNGQYSLNTWYTTKVTDRLAAGSGRSISVTISPTTGPSTPRVRFTNFRLVQGESVPRESWTVATEELGARFRVPIQMNAQTFALNPPNNTISLFAVSDSGVLKPAYQRPDGTQVILNTSSGSGAIATINPGSNTGPDVVFAFGTAGLSPSFTGGSNTVTFNSPVMAVGVTQGDLTNTTQDIPGAKTMIDAFAVTATSTLQQVNPETDAGFDLGSTIKRWGKLHLSANGLAVHNDLLDTEKAEVRFASGVAELARDTAAAFRWMVGTNGLSMSTGGVVTAYNSGGISTAALTTGTLGVARGGTNATGGFSTNGGFYWNGTSFVTSAPGGAGTLCWVSTDGGAPGFGSCSGSAATALSSITAASAGNTANHGDHAQVWNSSLTTSGKSFFTFGEDVAAVAAGVPVIVNIQTLSGSTANPLQVTAGGTANGVRVNTAGQLAAIGTGTIVATSLSATLNVAGGGTGATTLTSNGVLYGNGTSAVQITAQGAANSVLTANAGAPVFSSSPRLVSLGLGVAAPTAGLSIVGKTITTDATNAVGILDGSTTINKTSADTRVFYGAKFAATINNPGSNNTTVHVLAVDVTPTDVTNTSINLFNFAYNGATQGSLTSGGILNVTAGYQVNGSATSRTALMGNGTVGIFRALEAADLGFTIPFAGGGTGLTSASNNGVMISTGSAWTVSVIPNCANTLTEKLNYNNTSRAFLCSTDSGGSSPSFGHRVVTAASDSLGASDNFIDCSTASNAISFSLGASGAAGRVVEVRFSGSSGNNCTITNGSSTLVVLYAPGTVVYRGTGSNWAYFGSY